MVCNFDPDMSTLAQSEKLSWFRQSNVQKSQLSTAVRKALYASKICSYAQGLNIIRAKSISMGWNIERGELTRIWKVRTPSVTSGVSLS